MKKIILILVLTAIIGGIGTWGWFNAKWSENANQLDDSTHIYVPPGSSVKGVGKILHEKKIIDDEKIFYYYCRIKGKGKSLKHGHFLIPPKQSIVQMVEQLEQGKNATRRLTIPEGRASWEIFSILKNTYPKLDSLTWENLIQDTMYVRELGISQAPSLEGYLLPDTYYMPYEADEKALIEIMVKSTQKVMDKLTAQGESIPLKHLGWHGVMTIASVVEEETGSAEERPHIAGVFHNRLLKGMPLGADPTVRFIFRSLTGPIYKSQLESNNPYNTRKFAGLPPGPISNPGEAAIQAAMFPMNTLDLFFVAKDDGSKQHFFCPTLDCHNRYKEIAARNRGE